MLHRCKPRRMWTKRQLLIKLRKINLLKSPRCVIETLIVFFIIFFFTLMVMIKVIEYNNEPLRVDQNFIYFEPLSSFFRTEHNKDNIKVDWHDYIAINLEKSRTGPGENGKGIDSVPEDEEELNQRLFDENGYYGLISDKISVNRSVADLRHKDCWKLRYLKELPTVSVVIPFYNEHLSTLLRTIHSVVNRSPPELLKEVILVNDRSTKEFLYDDLKAYLASNFPKNLVKLFELPARSGLIAARLTGARAAIGDVLIFLDSHTEPNTNWLPPLLEPIAVNYRVCTCPFIDVIEFKTFEYVIQDEGSRGVFDWHLNYRKLELQPGFQHRPTDLFPSPVMAGGLFAISAKFFWELGGYDNKLDIWGGEQYELSFKIWLCGGEMYDVPCSRVGHVYRGSMPFEDDRKGTDFLSINYKRVAEVWMDEYKEYVYMRNPERYKNVDHGDISYQQSIRKKLQCKPFSYFINTVAPDMLEYFPFIDYPAFASGAIQSLYEPEICIDTYAKDTGNELGLYPCAADLENPHDTQFFTLRHFRDIEIKNTMFCLDKNEKGMLLTNICHHHQGNQYFRYDMDTQQIRFGGDINDECLDMDIEKTENDAIFLSKCDENSLTQKWKFGMMNETALRTWTVSGFDIYDPYEYRIMRQNGL
ncbi:N-acetylgalactosaminyltransferase 6-like [Chironomus tepperi]|uniref:N-acetylgalactosaminyltransferase 6-like n=1 Tax=Chironomus tepperi TaxID=113505 RepID=UPI00391F6695